MSIRCSNHDSILADRQRKHLVWELGAACSLAKRRDEGTCSGKVRLRDSRSRSRISSPSWATQALQHMQAAQTNEQAEGRPNFPRLDAGEKNFIEVQNLLQRHIERDDKQRCTHTHDWASERRAYLCLPRVPCSESLIPAPRHDTIQILLVADPLDLCVCIRAYKRGHQHDVRHHRGKRPSSHSSLGFYSRTS